jgi:hypothetical protein
MQIENKIQESTQETILAKQASHQEALQADISFQGKTISLFTIINLAFMPLQFFAQVWFSMHLNKWCNDG